MRIAYIINSLDAGGGAFPVPSIIDVMRGQGHEVSVTALMQRDGLARAGLDQAGIPYQVIGGPRRRYLSTARRLDRILRDQKPDVLWTSLTHATVTGQMLGKLRGIPVVSWLHNAWLKPANLAILRRSWPLSGHWVADSGVAAEFGRDRIGIAQDRLSVWPIYHGKPQRPRAESVDDRFVFGSLGRLHPNKGYDVLLRAIAALGQERPDLLARVQFRIGGNGPARDELEAARSALSLTNVDFVGHVHDTEAFLAGLDGYVQPSHHEGFCIAAHEALNAGLPVIASPVGEMQVSIARSGGGVLIPYGDHAALAKMLALWIEQRDEARTIGLLAAAWMAEHYSHDAFVRRGKAALLAAGVS